MKGKKQSFKLVKKPLAIRETSVHTALMDTKVAAANWRPGGDSNPRSVAAPEVGDSDNRSLLTVKSAGFDPTIPSPRECDCPEWVLRCVHFGDQTITLFEHLNKPLGSGCFALGRHAGPVEEDHCRCGLCSTFVYRNAFSIAGGPNYDDALAAFYAAEEALLAGGEA